MRIKKIWSEKLTRGVLFFQDKAPALKSTEEIVKVFLPPEMAALQECGFYSPDLTSSDFKHSSSHFYCNENIIAAGDHFLNVQNTHFNYVKIETMLHYVKNKMCKVF